MAEPPFNFIGDLVPASPVVISVPHAGRDYSPALMTALAATPAALAGLEDRYLDAVALAARGSEAMLIQRAPRAWIDLNRGEDERDPRVDEGAPRLPRHNESAKVRSGLGLVPRRAGSAGELWSRRFTDAEILSRIADAHRPYHDALARLLIAARRRWGIAVLLDLHSMPPLGSNAARIVIGDLFGRAASGQFVARLEAEASRARIRTALNAPYAGGHVLRRHGAPADGIHAIQIELDRSLYLDPALDRPGPGVADTAGLVRRMAAALADEAMSGSFPVAAE